MYRGVGADFEKQKQKISANNEQGSMKRGEKWFSEKLRKNIFRHILTRIPKNQKGRPAFRDRITRGSLESKIVYRGVGADFEKQKQKISANNEQGSMKRGEKWFSEKLRKNFDLENFRSESFSTRTSCIGSTRFRARVAKGRPVGCALFYKPIWQLTVNERGHYADSEDTFLFKIEDSPDTRLGA